MFSPQMFKEAHADKEICTVDWMNDYLVTWHVSDIKGILDDYAIWV